MNIINYKGTTYVFENKLDEDPKMFVDRTWYIVKNIEKHGSLERAEKLSFIWLQKKYYNVEYSPETELSIS